MRPQEAAARFPDMPSVIKSVSFDAVDALVLARFWAAVLGSDVDEDSTADKAFVEAAGWGGPNIWFTRVPEGKSAKNRVHFDLRAPGTVAAEVSRLEDLGATVVRAHPVLTVMQDPEGNEFCVEPGPGALRAGSLPSTRADGHVSRGKAPGRRYRGPLPLKYRGKGPR